MFDPPERVKYAQTPFSINEAPAHDRLAREMAQASVVLLKNTGVLPLAANTRKVAVIGPNADEIMTLVGNYYGTPSKPVTLAQGIRNALPHGEVVYARGVDLVENRQDPRAVPPIPSQYLRPAAGSTEQGLKGEYFKGKELQGAPIVTRVDRSVNFRWDRLNPTTELVQQGQMRLDQALGNDDFSVRWTGQLVPPVTGAYELTVTGDDGFRLDVAGTRVLDEWTPTPRARARSVRLDFEAGKTYDVKLEYFENIRDAEVRLNWKQPGAKDPYAEALEAAKAADVVIFAGGLNGEVEGEEMPVIYPGFAGGDRTEIALPKTQQRLLEDLHMTGKPVVLVLMTGSALAVDWDKTNLPAV
jgi:beta-glucosidase